MSQILEPTYLFIDGGHLRKYYAEGVREWFGNSGEINFTALKAQMQAFKVFYYDCLDDLRRSGESEEEHNERVSRQEAQFDMIRSVVGAHVRLGSLAGNKEKKRRQKEVDILLTVDMMNHAIRQNMRRAVLLTGDRDFKPVVESLVQMGMFVEIVGDVRHTSQELIGAADASKLLGLQDYFSISSSALINQYPLPAGGEFVYQDGYFAGQLVAKGKLDERTVTISFANAYNAYVPIPSTRNAYVFTGESPDRLKLYIKLKFGDVKWQ